MRRLPVVVVSLLVTALTVAAWMNGATSRRHLATLLLLGFFAGWLVVFAWSRSSASERSARFLIALAGLGMAIGLVETLALTGVLDARRLFAVGGRAPWLHPGNRFDPELLWRREPNSMLVITRDRGNLARALDLPAAGPARRYEVRYDGNGFRNPRDVASAGIVLLGDSFVEGAELPAEQTLPALLARATGDTVVSLGLGGYGPQQALAALRRHGLPLAPRVVVWCFYEGNDLADALRYEDHVARLAAGMRRAPSPLERLVTVNAFEVLWRAAGRPDTSLASGRRGQFRGGGAILFGDRCDRLGVHERDGLAILERCLAEAAALGRSRDFRLLVAFVPNKFRVLRDHVRFPRHSECLDWTPPPLPELLDDMTSRLPGTEFLDLTAALAAPLPAGRLTYLADDTHWTPLGHQQASEAIARRLAEPPLR